MSFFVCPRLVHIGLISLLVGLVLLEVKGQPTTDDAADVNFNLIDEVAKLKTELTQLKANIRSKQLDHH